MALKDPRIPEGLNEQFLDMLEDYFAQPYETKLKDARPELHYQVGVTPGGREDPKCRSDETCQRVISQLEEGERPETATGPDPKWRFFWRIGETRPSTQFPALNAPPVVPESQDEVKWKKTMNAWGGALHDAGISLTRALALGLGLPHEESLASMVKGGPHLLAPTGSDLTTGEERVGRVLAGFHYDLNLLTLHGRSRYPGLHIWARNTGKRLAPRVPPGCLLVQAGKQLEWLTGGAIRAGYHEVVILPGTLEAVEKTKAQTPNPDAPVWRVSSTFFLHTASDELLAPIPPTFPEDPEKYPAMRCGDYVQRELSTIRLASTE